MRNKNVFNGPCVVKMEKDVPLLDTWCHNNYFSTIQYYRVGKNVFYNCGYLKNAFFSV